MSTSEHPIIAIVDASAGAYVQLLEARFPSVTFVGASDFETLRQPGFDAVGLITFGLTLTSDQFAKFHRLTWVQALSTGVDHLLPLVRSRGLALSSARGIHGAAVSELAMLLMLALARGLPRMMRAQARREWAGFDGTLLAGKYVGIIGLGVISVELARKCNAFGMTVTAFTSVARDTPFVNRVRSYAEIADEVGGLDFLVSIAPLNARSERMIDAPLLARAKPGLLFVNVGRGGTVDEAALVDALRNGPLGGAGLDTVDPEPLDPASPLWDMDNVILTPHVGGRGDSYVDRVASLLIENIKAFLAGEALTNRVEATAATGVGSPRTR